MHKKKKIPHLTVFRTIVQLVFFVLLPGLYVNAFLGIKTVYQGLLDHNLSLTTSLPQFVSAIAILPITLLFGRFFCGFMCAFGTLGDFLYYLSHRVFKIKYRIDEEADAALKYIKYALLLFIIIVIWTFQAFNISSLSPWDAFGSLLTFTSLPDFSFVITEVTVGFLLLIAIMIGSLFVERFFCRYFCPLGAVFAIISRLKFIRIKKPYKDCGSCKACTRKCSMGIPLYEMNSVASGECIDCMKCVTVCPRENVSVTAATAVTNPALTGALAVTAITGLYYIGTFASDANTGLSGNTSVTEGSTENTNIYADGIYEGSGTGFRGATTKVSVTVEGGVITNIQAISYGDDRPYFSSAFSNIVNRIISSQSSDVDTVSGATFSSNGIIEAVSNALDSAMQAQSSSSDAATATSDSSTSDNTSEVTATITPESSDKVAATLADEVTSAPKTNSTDTSSSKSDSSSTSSKGTGTSSKDTGTKSSGSTSSSKDSSTSSATATPSPTDTPSTPTTSANYKYADGTYEGSANGFRRGITTVSVTIKKDSITDIQIISNGDDAPFFNSACDTIISEILGAQSANVDTVSGATYSSLGIMNAVADALSSAEIS